MKIFSIFFLTLIIVASVFFFGGCVYENGVVEVPNYNDLNDSEEIGENYHSANNEVSSAPVYTPETIATSTPEPTSESTDIPTEDFILTISVEESTLPQGEQFRVTVKLKNNSGEDVEILYSILTFPFIPNWHISAEIPVADPPEPRISLIEAGSSIQCTARGIGRDGWRFGYTLEPGTHELRFRTGFNLLGQDESQRIEIWSNTLILTVL